MNLPLDLEDVVGVALADALRRAALIVAVLAGGALIAMLGLFAGEFTSDLIRFGSASFGLPNAGMFLVAILPAISPWGMVYLPLLLGMAFYCVKSESADGRVLAGCAGAIAAIQIFTVAGVGQLGWLTTGLALAVAVGCAGSLGFLAVLVGHWRQRRAEEHFIGVAVENERRREEMERRNAGIVLDEPEAAE